MKPLKTTFPKILIYLHHLKVKFRDWNDGP